MSKEINCDRRLIFGTAVNGHCLMHSREYTSTTDSRIPRLLLAVLIVASICACAGRGSRPVVRL